MRGTIEIDYPQRVDKSDSVDLTIGIDSVAAYGNTILRALSHVIAALSDVIVVARVKG